MPKLFAVYLGGRAERSNIELHDVVFVVADTIEESYDQLLEKWFGVPEGLHLDSWLELDVIDQHRVTLKPEPSAGPQHLYFINLGAYTPDEFGELHANVFLIGENDATVKARAKAQYLRGAESVHKDYLYDVDECIKLESVDGLHVHLEPVAEPKPLVFTNAYHVIPKSIISSFRQRKLSNIRS